MDAQRVTARPHWYGSPSHRRGVPVGSAPDPGRVAGRHRASGGSTHQPIVRRAPDSDGGVRRTRALTALTVALAVAAGATLAVRLTTHPARPGQPAQGVAAAERTPALVQAATAWLSANLPRSATFVADDTVRAALISSGFPASAVRQPGRLAGCADVSFVVVTPSLAPDVARGGCAQAGLPVAVFGSGPAAVRITE